MFDLTSEERDYLMETLEAAHTQLLHQLHHADASSFRLYLRNQVSLNERVTALLEVPVSALAV